MSEERVRGTTTYRVARGVRWAVETRGLLVMDSRGLAHWLGYPESALWDLFSRGCAPARAASMMKHIASVEPSEAEQLVARALEGWVGLGLMERR